jgi:hypothetical protein
VPATAARRPAAVPVTIAACAALALALRAYQLSRPGYLLGVTEYDDGVLFGNALRLVSGVVPYRDFAMVQPPGSALLMVPVALLAKVTGTAWGLAVARILTVCADTANVVLLGVLVRHRGPVTAGVACGLYAVYPDALVAAHTFLLEPWLNLCCLAAAALIFDGARLATADCCRLALGGAAFGFAVAVKIWALVPLAVAGLVVVAGTRRVRPALTLAGGAAAGLGVPLAPFALLAPGGLARGVLVGQLVRNASGSRDLTRRLAELAGAQGPLSLPARFPWPLLLAAIGAAIAGLYAAAYLAAGRRPAALDAYALLGAVAVTGMLLWPRLYYPPYGAFDGPFLALAVALPAGLLPDALLSGGLLPGACCRGPAAGGPLPGGPLPRGPLAASVAAGRFYSDVAGCPAMTDSFGTLIAMTGGHPRDASPAALAPVIALWHATLEQATYRI